MTSSSSVETISTAVPSSRLATIRLWMYSIEPTSRPRVGWRRDQQLERPRELARHDHLLLVAAGQVADVVEDRWRADVELLDQLRGGLADGVAVEREPVREGRQVVAG